MQFREGHSFWSLRFSVWSTCTYMHMLAYNIGGRVKFHQVPHCNCLDWTKVYAKSERTMPRVLYLFKDTKHPQLFTCHLQEERVVSLLLHHQELQLQQKKTYELTKKNNQTKFLHGKSTVLICDYKGCLNNDKRIRQVRLFSLPFKKKRMYLWWSSCTLYLHACQVWLGSLLLCLCDVFWVLNNSLVCSSLLIQNFQHSLCFLPDYVSGGSCHPSQHVSPGWKLQLTNLTLCTPSCINYNSAFCTVFAKSRPLSCFPLLPTFQEFQNLIQHLSTLYTSHPLHPFTLTRSVMVSHDRQGWICLAI